MNYADSDYVWAYEQLALIKAKVRREDRIRKARTIAGIVLAIGLNVAAGYIAMFG